MNDFGEANFRTASAQDERIAPGSRRIRKVTRPPPDRSSLTTKGGGSPGAAGLRLKCIAQRFGFATNEHVLDCRVRVLRDSIALPSGMATRLRKWHTGWPDAGARTKTAITIAPRAGSSRATYRGYDEGTENVMSAIAIAMSNPVATSGEVT